MVLADTDLGCERNLANEDLQHPVVTVTLEDLVLLRILLLQVLDPLRNRTLLQPQQLIKQLFNCLLKLNQRSAFKRFKLRWKLERRRQQIRLFLRRNLLPTPLPLFWYAFTFIRLLERTDLKLIQQVENHVEQRQELLKYLLFIIPQVPNKKLYRLHSVIWLWRVTACTWLGQHLQHLLRQHLVVHLLNARMGHAELLNDVRLGVFLLWR